MIQVIRGSVISNRVEQVTQFVYDIRDRVIQINKGVSGDVAANSQDMTDSYNVYPTLYTISQTVYDNGGVGDGYVTQDTKILRHRIDELHRHQLLSHLSWPPPWRRAILHEWFDTKRRSGRTRSRMSTGRAGHDDGPVQCRSHLVDRVLTGDGYPAYASSTSTNRLTENATLYDDLDRVYQTQQYDISPSTGTGTNYLVARTRTTIAMTALVASAPAYAAGTETAYDGAGRQYETRTVTALQSTPYSSGAYQYCARLRIRRSARCREATMAS